MQKLTRAASLLSAFLILMLGSTTCKTNEPISCEVIYETIFSTFPAQETNPAVVRHWIAEQYTVVDASLNEWADIRGQYHYRWSLNKKDYQIQVGKDGADLIVDWKDRKPNLEEVIGCFGKPEYYEARVIPPSDAQSLTYFGIWYPSKRIFIYTTQPSSNLVVNQVTTFNTLSVPSSSSVRLMKLKPWPTTSNDLQVDPSP